MIISKILNDNKELFWDISNLNKLDNIAIEERFLQYWNWKNILDLQEILWKENFKQNYIKIKSKKRLNLSDKTINFFNLYLDV